jgi:hypothetical protein
MPGIFHLKYQDYLLEVPDKKYYIETAGCKISICPKTTGIMPAYEYICPIPPDFTNCESVDFQTVL